MAKSKDRSARSRASRRQATPPLVLNTEKKEPQSGVSRVNKEIATLIARKDPVLNQVSKKSKSRLSKKKKERLEAKMIKGEAKEDQLVEKTAKAHQRGREIKKRRADWDAINEKKIEKAKADAATDEMKID